MQNTETLVELAKAGERSAFGTLVARYERAAVATALPIVGDFHHAQDVAQDCFVDAFASLGKLRQNAAFGPWLLTSVRRRALKVAARRREFSLTEEASEQLLMNQPWLEELKEVLPLLGNLPEHELDVLNLRYFGGRPVVDIAEELGRSVGTVTKQLSRAVQRLRQMVQEHQP
ncbi:MAG: sigma-70 family RNA polymerase sigma factor [Planctomycetota bacterium]